jgi:hypothetical protein
MIIIKKWLALVPHPGFDSFISYSCFKEFKCFLPDIWVNNSTKKTDPWYKLLWQLMNSTLVERHYSDFLRWKVRYESMIAGRPRTTALGGLRIVPLVVQKLEPLGTDFKTSAYPVTGVMTMMEIQRDKGGMKEKRCNRELL